MKTCPKCNRKTVRIKVNLFLDIPGGLHARLNKQILRSKDVKIDGVGWDRMLMYCTRVECGWLVNMKD